MERDVGRLHEALAPRARPVGGEEHGADAGGDVVRASREGAQRVACPCRATGLPERFVADPDDGGVGHVAQRRAHRLRLLRGKPPHELRGRLAGQTLLVYVCGDDLEGKSRAAEQVPSARGL